MGGEEETDVAWKGWHGLLASHIQKADQGTGDLSSPRLFFSQTTTSKGCFSFTFLVLKTSDQKRNWSLRDEI